MRLPYFPLHVVVFPHLPLPIHVFEERYRLMTHDVVADGSPFAGRFVVSMLTEGSEVEETGSPQPQPQPRAERIGTIVEVRNAERFADGRWALLVVGEARAIVSEIDHSGPYATARVEVLQDGPGDAERATQLLPRVQAALDAYLQTVKQFVASAASLGSDSPEITTVAASLDEVLKPIRLPDDPLAASYAVAGVLQIELTRKQQLLELPDAATRLGAELDLLRREVRLLSDGAMPPVATADLRYHPN
jgi:Lon protease-like protein